MADRIAHAVRETDCCQSRPIDSIFARAGFNGRIFVARAHL